MCGGRSKCPVMELLRENSNLGGLENPQKSLKYLAEIEAVGEEILVDRQEIIALDRRRNETREGLRAVTNQLKVSPNKKTWFVIGSLLVKLPLDKAKELLQKDQVNLDAEINKLRSNLKVKVNKLRDLEFQSPITGYMLKPLSQTEMKAINQVLTGKSSP